MSGKTNSQAAAPDVMQPMWQPWLDFWGQMNEQRSDWVEMMLAGAPPNIDLPALRKRWLETLGKSLDAYLRSPPFLEGMKRNLDATTALKTTSELASREVTRQIGLPHVEDISGLYERLQTGQELLLARLSQIEQRLTSIESKFNEVQHERAAG